MSEWKALPNGQDVTVTPHTYYAVVASISASTTKATIVSHIPSGVEVLEYYEQGDPQAPGLAPDPDKSRKRIAVLVHTSSWQGTLSWQKSLLWIPIYTLAGVWSAPGGAQPPAAPPWGSAANVQNHPSPWPWILGTVGVGGAVYGAWRWHRSQQGQKKRMSKRRPARLGSAA